MTTFFCLRKFHINRILRTALLMFGFMVFGNAWSFTSSEHKAMTQDWVKQSKLDFQPRSLHWFMEAAHTADRHPWFDDGTWHCDNADYFPDGKYPANQSRKQADRQLQACVKRANTSFQQAVAMADKLVDANGNPIKSALIIGSCQFDNNLENPKCYVLGQLGRAMHTIADFYAHSTMADYADDKNSTSITNPKGLALDHTHSPFQFQRYNSNINELNNLGLFEDFLKQQKIDEVITGCYPDYGYTAGGSPSDDHGYESTSVENCENRITHDGVFGISKDSQTKPRGKIMHNGKTNFQRVREEALADFDAMWKSFTAVLTTRYGTRSTAMIQALEKD